MQLNHVVRPTQLTEKLPLWNYQFVCLQAERGMLSRPKRFVLIKLNHFLDIVETLGAGLQTPPRLRLTLQAGCEPKWRHQCNPA
ncbi:hypothetical protein Mettu_2752 [Methylobacter tundripaludum SV96]|uniref:Uncharacterized protein n=1 Tax=Methylobacter tundripaludum (strain ATCC BAA-1195 / DSM 17260 / SV96) TaxID=697282 RepID=G3J1N8_METTV|nr:hypothetical protein Mettu_2752 [Methylobacter tundripaludum SV96]